MSSSLGDVLATMELERLDQWLFVGQQLPAPANHILGGHISAQSLMAASHTAPGRAPHSVHTYFLRPGDSRRPVEFDVADLQEGRTFSARRVTARQDGTILMEAMSSFKVIADRVFPAAVSERRCAAEYFVTVTNFRRRPGPLLERATRVGGILG